MKLSSAGSVWFPKFRSKDESNEASFTNLQVKIRQLLPVRSGPPRRFGSGAEVSAVEGTYAWDALGSPGYTPTT